MKVRDRMTREVVTLSVDDVLVTAEEMMGLRRFRHLPVVDDGRLVGLVTAKDLLRATLHHGSAVEREIHAAKIRVRDVMRAKVATLSPDDELGAAAGIMVREKYGCMPVVDDAGRLVGILTEADFVAMVQALLDHAATDPAFMARLTQAR